MTSALSTMVSTKCYKYLIGYTCNVENNLRIKLWLGKQRVVGTGICNGVDNVPPAPQLRQYIMFFGSVQYNKLVYFIIPYTNI